MKNNKIFFWAFLAILACPIFFAQAAETTTKPEDQEINWEQYYQQMYLSTSSGMGAVMDWSQPGFDFGSYQKKISELLNATTGKMTVALDLEITARIAACHTSSAILGDEEFNKLKEPFDVTPSEYTAYHLKLFQTIMEDAEFGGQYPLNEVYEKRVEELKKNGCNFETVPEGINKEGCTDEDGDNPDRFGTVYVYDKAGEGKCRPCKYEDECVGSSVREKICIKDEKKCIYGCWADVMHKCQFGCFAGHCLTEEESKVQQCDGQCLAECPAGTMDFGQGGCPKVAGAVKAKCCKKVFNTSTQPVGTCAGVCMNSAQCPEGYEKKDETSCAQIETKYKCGPFNLLDCYNYASPSCCIPKAGASQLPPIEPCAGQCVMGEKCSGRQINKGPQGCESFQECKPCGFFGMKKCCKYLPTTCCEPPQRVAKCTKGMCTNQSCPEGMEDVGQADCEDIKECKTCYWVAKCCKKKTARCCMDINRETCAKGSCQKSAICPPGFKNIGTADCGSYQKEEGCGLFSKCKQPAPMTCCMPEK